VALTVSSSLQDYLEAVLNLEDRNDAVRITDLAEELRITKPSVTAGVRVLVQMGLLTHRSYGPVVLTESGRRQALEVRHRHCMLKRFLIEVLEVPAETAEKEACIMEHAVSPETISRLVRFLEKSPLPLAEPMLR